jgi:hypothetical protein
MRMLNPYVCRRNAYAGLSGGWDLCALLRICGVDEEAVQRVRDNVETDRVTELLKFVKSDTLLATLSQYHREQLQRAATRLRVELREHARQGGTPCVCVCVYYCRT